MLRWIINRRLNKLERNLGVSLDYARHILRVSLPAFFKFIRLMPLAEHRRSMPTGPFHAARLVVTRHDDCGECVQIVVQQAKQDGLSVGMIQSILDGRLDELPEEVAEACRFAEAVVTMNDQLDDLRERIRTRFGEEGLVELALAIGVCRVPPATKRALGYAKSCSLIPIRV